MEHLIITILLVALIILQNLKIDKLQEEKKPKARGFIFRYIGQSADGTTYQNEAVFFCYKGEIPTQKEVREKIKAENEKLDSDNFGITNIIELSEADFRTYFEYTA